MEIVTLVENSCYDSRLQGEFGLSLLLHTTGGAILFDMGTTSLFAENCITLDNNLVDVDCAVISHAHYDHGGGVETFLQKNTTAPVFIGPKAAGNYFGNISAKLPPFLENIAHAMVGRHRSFCRYIGLDQSVLNTYADRFTAVDKTTEILDDVFVISDIVKNYSFAEGNKYLLEERDGKLVEDCFDHELILVVRESDGLIVLTGCGHSGILNMVQTVEDIFKGEPVKAVVGGFHLALQAGKPRIAGTRDDIIHIAQTLLQRGVHKVITGHCTGADACSIFEQELGEQFEALTTGSRHTVF